MHLPEQWSPRNTLVLVAALLILIIISAGVTRADIRELLAGPMEASQQHAAHVAMVFDTSAVSGQTLPVRAPFDAAAADDLLAVSGCDSNRIYWRRGVGVPPDCHAAASVDRRDLTCDAAVTALEQRGIWVGRGLAQWSQHDGTPRWRLPDGLSSAPVECAADRGRHGSSPGAWYARNGDDAHRWTHATADEIDWQEAGLDQVYTLFDARYLAWWHHAAHDSTTTAGDALLAGAVEFARHLGPTTLSMLRYSHDAAGTADLDADGGMVILATTAADQFEPGLPTLRNWLLPGGGAPQTETLFEATKHLSGGAVFFGSDSHLAPTRPWPSVATSRSAQDFTHYASPITHACQRTFVAGLLTTRATQDWSGERLVPTLPDFGTLIGSGCDGSGDGKCLDELARYLSRADLRGDLPGRQAADTLWLMLDPLNRGDGWTARDSTLHGGAWWTDDAGLVAPLLAGAAIERVMQPAAAVSALPAVTGSTLADGEDLFVASVEPTATHRWRGNVRRYRLGPVAVQSSDWQIVDRSGQLALDTASGDIRRGTTSLWSRHPDVAITDGGAAAALPVPTERRIYTDLAGNDLTAPENRLIPANPGLTPMLLGLTADERKARDTTLNWLLGVDTEDADRDGDESEARQDLGATAQARLATVRYSRAADDGLLFVPTSDGLLHAFDLATGTERWAYLPGELLPHIDALRRDLDTGAPAPGLDADVVAWRLDANRDGRIQAGTQDQAFLFLGLGQSGRTLLALDVTDPMRPRVLWRATPAQLPGLGQTWARPVITHLSIAGAGQSPAALVAILAGGFDPSERHGLARAGDIEGNRLYIVDALTGRLLWFAGGAGAGTPDLPLERMTHALAATPRVLDLDGDQRADRIYAADLGGQLWRFDLRSGVPAATLVQAGVIAELGNSGVDAGADHRQFYFEPDVSEVVREVPRPFLAVTVGSGFLPHALSQGTADRLYSIRDYARAPMTAVDWAALRPVKDDALTDVTDGNVTIPPLSRGWKRRLLDEGEKIAGVARTIDHRVYLPTFVPPDPVDGVDCLRQSGRSRLYALDLRTGRPAAFRVNESPEDLESLELTGQHLGQTLGLIFPRAISDCTGAACRPRPVALLGAESIPLDFANRAVKTVWAEREAP